MKLKSLQTPAPDPSLARTAVTRAGLLALLSATACGIQGGTEGEESGGCVYERIETVGADAAPEGFDASPRDILGPAEGSFEGSVAGHDVTLSVLPDLSMIEALYDTSGGPQCTPRLESNAQVTLAFSRQMGPAGSLTHVASLSLARLGGLNAGIHIEVDAASPLQSIVPEFSGTPVGAPVLHVALGDVAHDAISSDWRWSAFVACAAGAQCAGAAAPGAAVPTTGDEVVWGGATLSRR